MLNKDVLLTLQTQIESIARIAGKKTLEVYEQSFTVTEKKDRTPVTDADYISHKYILERLGALSISFPILSEESIDIPYAQRRQWETYWLVDPLDGTREFIKRNGEFSVNIALIHQGCPLIGMVYAPVLDVTYFAVKNHGAFKRQGTQSAKQIKVSKVGKPILVAASRSHPSSRLDQYLACLGEHQLVLMGSSLKSCLVAEGKADLYPRLGITSEWDTAACQCIVEEAGGHFVDLSGRQMSYNKKSSLLNPEFLVFGDDSRDWLSCVTGANL